MKPRHHPDLSTLLAYASGSITESFSLLIAAHLERCAECRKKVTQAETVGADLIKTLPQTEMSATALTKVWNSINNSPRVKQPKGKQIHSNGIPGVLSILFPNGLQQMEWSKLAPGIQHHKLTGINSGAGTIRLLQIDKGASIPEHTHQGTELTFILQGSYSDEVGLYLPGDLSDADSSIKHSPVVNSEQPCMCLIATDERLVFSNMFNRIIQPFIGM